MQKQIPLFVNIKLMPSLKQITNKSLIKPNIVKIRKKMFMIGNSIVQ